MNTAKKIIISPDSFKGSISSRGASQAIAAGVKNVLPEADVVCIPIADGGEGTLDALTSESDRFLCQSFNANGEKITSRFGRIGDIAVIEIAESVGLCLIPENSRNLQDTTTKGVGVLILHALDLGFRRLLLTVGGSGSNDGGAGMLSALGARFFDQQGRELDDIRAGELENIARIDVSGVDSRLYNIELTLACDVTNPMLGPSGATYIFGPQKGADIATLDRLEYGMANYAHCLAKISEDASNIPGTGAGGGLPTPLIALFGSKLCSGIESVLSSVDYENRIKDADLIITGEGSIDYQSAYGKAIGGVAKVAAKYGIPVLAIVGCTGDRADDMLSFGVSEIFAISSLAPDTDYSISHAKELLTKGAELTVKKYFCK